jgi:hypothetical protein
MEQNAHCYRVENRTYPNSIFTDTIDATYVLHLVGNGRIPSMNQQLRNTHPTKILHILHNPGFKKCKKELTQQSSVYDLIDGMVTIFRHALERGYTTVLVLEDDFIFSPEISKRDSIHKINKFINNHKETDFVYQLGAIPILRIPYNDDTNLSVSSGSHANVYSRLAMQRIMTNYTEGAIQCHFDLYHMLYGFSHKNTFMFKSPLIYQTLPMTENRASWAVDGISGQIQTAATNFFISATGMDKTPEPGTSILYLLSLIIPIVIIGLLILVIYQILKWIDIRYLYKLTIKRFSS